MRKQLLVLFIKCLQYAREHTYTPTKTRREREREKKRNKRSPKDFQLGTARKRLFIARKSLSSRKKCEGHIVRSGMRGKYPWNADEDIGRINSALGSVLRRGFIAALSRYGNEDVAAARRGRISSNAVVHIPRSFVLKCRSGDFNARIGLIRTR